jgi:UDP-N-acetylglucosamine--N-acetylmuramyl-(pentapeptide) pyrophosphoryl-undecaprenol N-acetylglucosamine transferase
MHVVLAGGGTAGHIEPAMNLADALRAKDPNIQVTALGTSKGLETTLVPARGYHLALIPAVPLPRRPNTDLASLPIRLRSAVRAVREVLDDTDASVVVGFGGYVAMPAYFAARKRTPIVVHEANARAGLANRIGARFTPYVAETVAGSLPNAELIGLPLRASIALLDRAARRAEARAYFGLAAELPTLLVSGGSQGARRLNDLVTEAASDLIAAGVQILHVVGPRNEDQRCRPRTSHRALSGSDGSGLRRGRSDGVSSRCYDLR